MTYEEFGNLVNGKVIINDKGWTYVMTKAELLYPDNPNEPFSIIRHHKFPYDGYRMATEEETAKFFEKLNANGYYWNPETELVEKDGIEVGNKYWWPSYPYKGGSLEVTVLDGPMKPFRNNDEYYWIEDSYNRKYWVNAEDLGKAKPETVCEEKPKMERYFKVEGDIIYPDETMLTWGPFYYHSKEKAMDKMQPILNDIVEWVNEKDPTLEIRPEELLTVRDGSQTVFKIKAWKDDTTIQKCKGIITVDEIFFNDSVEKTS